ncbi:hypothetical protein F4813DRAFT_359824 [Daldinia decipiens]|uniref:uncharacterized protein n=1 Tax=Daldinia decipiens TaxID=326647 RepID=UPI0020C20712|nr:uncharacterized protein F4813DRAFT_359824 [Daldinia decipiens]KAI1657418.1 hypothetical protein F4813DRAFT_359824 [Daldinia decipiens]
MISTRLCSFMAYIMYMYVVATATRSLHLRLLGRAVGCIGSTRGIHRSVQAKPCGCPATDRQRVLRCSSPGNGS